MINTPIRNFHEVNLKTFGELSLLLALWKDQQKKRFLLAFDACINPERITSVIEIVNCGYALLCYRHKFLKEIKSYGRHSSKNNCYRF